MIKNGNKINSKFTVKDVVYIYRAFSNKTRDHSLIIEPRESQAKCRLQHKNKGRIIIKDNHVSNLLCTLLDIRKMVAPIPTSYFCKGLQMNIFHTPSFRPREEKRQGRGDLINREGERERGREGEDRGSGGIMEELWPSPKH